MSFSPLIPFLENDYTKIFDLPQAKSSRKAVKCVNPKNCQAFPHSKKFEELGLPVNCSILFRQPQSVFLFLTIRHCIFYFFLLFYFLTIFIVFLPALHHILRHRKHLKIRHFRTIKRHTEMYHLRKLPYHLPLAALSSNSE